VETECLSNANSMPFFFFSVHIEYAYSKKKNTRPGNNLGDFGRDVACVVLNSTCWFIFLCCWFRFLCLQLYCDGRFEIT
jgi:hypothetical protein